MDLFAWLREWEVSRGGGGRKEGELSLPFPHSAPSQESSRRKSRIPLRVTWYSTWYLLKKTLFPPFRAQDQERDNVLEIDSKGNLYLYRSALLCKNEIIKRLTEDNFKLVEPSTIGKVQSFTSYSQNSGVTSLAPLPNLRTTDALNASAVRRLPTPQLSTKYTYNSHRQATRKKK